MERQIIHNTSSAGPRASSATKELDDLMASLSDFKVSSKTFMTSLHHGPKTNKFVYLKLHK